MFVRLVSGLEKISGRPALALAALEISPHAPGLLLKTCFRGTGGWVPQKPLGVYRVLPDKLG
jgi:hypothetical protein